MVPKLYTVAWPGPGTVSTMGHPAGGWLLEEKVRALRAAGVDVVVSAQTDAERVLCDLVEEERAVVAAGMRYVCLPVEDRGVPEVEAAVAMVRPLYALYLDGAHVVFHCWAGVGRASLLAAMLLGMDGVPPREAWRLISAARGRDVPDTVEQVEWLAAWWLGEQRQ